MMPERAIPTRKRTNLKYEIEPFQLQALPGDIILKLTAIINRAVEGSRDPRNMPIPRSVLSPVPAEEIHETVLQVIWSSGFAFADEEQKLFQELRDSARDRIRRSDAERLLKIILDAPDPLIHPLWWAEASDLRLSLNGVLRSKWAAKWKKEGRNQDPSLRSVRWDRLTDDERSELRDMIWQIGMSFPLSLPRGPRRKDRIDQLIRDLVLAYHQLRGDDRPDQAFSTSSNSRINQFVDQAFECLRRNRPGAVQFSSSNVYRRVVRLAQETRAEQNKAGEKTHQSRVTSTIAVRNRPCCEPERAPAFARPATRPAGP